MTRAANKCLALVSDALICQKQWIIPEINDNPSIDVSRGNKSTQTTKPIDPA